MSILAYAVLGIYCIALFYITSYCLLQFHLLYKYSRGQQGTIEKDTKELTNNAALPFVTVQLPIYNELYVIERLIDRVTEFHYPKDKFEIHIPVSYTHLTLTTIFLL